MGRSPQNSMNFSIFADHMPGMGKSVHIKQVDTAPNSTVRTMMGRLKTNTTGEIILFSTAAYPQINYR